MTEESAGETTGPAAGPLIRDVVVYTLARLALVVALTAVILFAGRLFGIAEVPLVVAMLFAILISMPLGLWLLAPLRNRATAGIAIELREDEADFRPGRRGEV